MKNFTTYQARLILWVIIGLIFISACSTPRQSNPLGTVTNIPSSTTVVSTTPMKTNSAEPISRDELTITDFYFIEYGMRFDEITRRIGEADEDAASGVYDFVYELKGGPVVHLICSSNDAVIFLVAAYYESPDGTLVSIVEPRP